MPRWAITILFCLLSCHTASTDALHCHTASTDALLPHSFYYYWCFCFAGLITGWSTAWLTHTHTWWKLYKLCPSYWLYPLVLYIWYNVFPLFCRIRLYISCGWWVVRYALWAPLLRAIAPPCFGFRPATPPANSFIPSLFNLYPIMCQLYFSKFPPKLFAYFSEIKLVGKLCKNYDKHIVWWCYSGVSMLNNSYFKIRSFGTNFEMQI